MKLYIVTVTRTAMVWAENVGAAFGQESEINSWQDPTCEAREADGKRADGWTDHDLVYHDGDGDITVAEAEEMARQALPPVRCEHTRDMFE